MNEIIQLASQTPLPTILVISGIVFIFIAIGGRLGATVETSTVKKNIAGALGGLLLVTGVILYFGGKIDPKSMDYNEKNGMLGEKKYLLRPESIPAGRLIQSETKNAVNEGNLIIKSPDGSISNGNISIEYESLENKEIVSSEAGLPTIIKSTVIKDAAKSKIKIGNQNKEHKTIVENPLIGETVLIEMKDGKWVKTLLGSNPTSDKMKKLHETYSDDSEIYPKEPVTVGHTWTIQGYNISSMLGIRNLLSGDGSAILHLEKVQECGEDTCGVIILKRIEYQGKYWQDDKLVNFKIGGSCSSLRSLTKFIDLKSSCDLSVQYNYSDINDSKEYDISISGVSVLNHSEKLVAK